ncbi:TerC family protein [Dehalogenimonas alkenigignens]|uniref:Integral membrane protein, TerC family n=1 Tax=Dehalogenimonas alkenigignens TaxID=1217799 RepID=A0A0W0GI01_9CHLR|nr:TerC family protein [Dehalogenimonas alkenigignens]KTB48199.1 integral membrane protein, TerC family [Dehalogenimonas alkenigignens]PVV84438.1 TerC family protein [Dehalogenimonas alkenigignens]
MDVTIWHWVGFNVFLVTMLMLDLFVFHRKAHVIQMKESLRWTAFWVGLAIIFGLGIWYFEGSGSALDFFSGYLVEESLSVDNLFVFLMLFTYFCVPKEHQYRVLFWGILIAIVLRAAFIVGGIALFHALEWMVYVFGAFLIFTGVRMGMQKEDNPHPEANPVVKLLCKFLPMTPKYHGGKFFTKENGRRVATPLFMVFAAINLTDIIFAVDSIPAILAITDDPFIVYTSNMFAIMGLRSVYFALSGFAERLHYLHYGLSAVLIFLGIKMVLSDILHIPTLLSLLIIGSILAAAVIASLRRPPEPRPVPDLSCPPKEDGATCVIDEIRKEE